MSGSDVSSTFIAPAVSDDNGISTDATLSEAGNLSINGALASGGSVTFDQPRNVIITSAGDDSGDTFTVTGTDETGSAQTEAITGADTGVATGTKFFATVTQIAASGAVGTNTSVGNAAGTTGGQAVVFAGRTRVRGMHITTGGTVGNISYFNSSPISGTSLFSFQVATTTKDYIDPYIPDDGVLFDSGAFLDLPAGTAVSVTTFFDG